MKNYIKYSLLFYLLSVVCCFAYDRGKYNLELTLITDDNRHRPFVYSIILDRKGYAKFEFNDRRFLKKEYEKAKRKLAIKDGFIPQVYGDDYYKLVKVRNWTYKMTEVQNDKVVAQGRGH